MQVVLDNDRKMVLVYIMINTYYYDCYYYYYYYYCYYYYSRLMAFSRTT